MKTSSLHVVCRKAIPKWMGPSLKLPLWGSTSGHAHSQCMSQAGTTCFTVANSLEHIQTCLLYPLCPKKILNSRNLDAVPNYKGNVFSQFSLCPNQERSKADSNQMTVVQGGYVQSQTFKSERSRHKNGCQLVAGHLPDWSLLLQ